MVFWPIHYHFDVSFCRLLNVLCCELNTLLLLETQYKVSQVLLTAQEENVTEALEGPGWELTNVNATFVRLFSSECKSNVVALNIQMLSMKLSSNLFFLMCTLVISLKLTKDAADLFCFLLPTQKCNCESILFASILFLFVCVNVNTHFKVILLFFLCI